MHKLTIIVRLYGGLGNQLFQYAAGRRLSVLHGTILKMDTSQLCLIGRSYNLSPFSIQGNFATPQEVAALTGNSISYFKEPSFDLSYKENILKTRRDVYLEGYWQSERYFADISQLILREFRQKDPLDLNTQKSAEKIQQSESVSLHFRRGDYVENPKVRSLLGNLGMKYYEKCIQLVGERIEHPQFFVFSDDIDWVAENLHIGYPMTFVTHNGSKNYDDLRLMSMCKHNIVANSSFSWWGAWLNSNPGKLVLAPSRWFADPRFNTCDLVPNGWIKVDNDFPYS